MAEKTTQKELFARIAEVMAEDPEVVEMCEKYIEKLSRPRVKTENKEAVEFRASVATWLSENDGAFTNSELAEVFGVSYQKMSSALRVLVKDGVVTRIESAEGEKKAKPVFTMSPEQPDVDE